MASSDDEGESLAHTVSNYYFVDDKDEPISFSELPVQWNEGESPEGKREQTFLHGTADNGLQKIYKQVTAWKFDLSDAKPEILVLSKENNWIKLQKPRKSYEDTIRTILITVHCLHFVKKNPETSGRSLWDHLAKVFSLYEVKPSENDIMDHITLISEAVKRDETLAKSKLLVAFLEEKPRKRKALDEDVRTTANSGFIVDDDMIDEAEEDGSDEEDELFDSVCSICDNGGELLCCEGRCMRSFHATVEAGTESTCKSLRLSDEQVEAIQNFFCKNCQYKQHQCFSCGELGSSDKSSDAAEVFACVSATCGRFYHPHCVAKLLHCESETDAEELQKKIAAGESFTCPVHKCHVCKQGENKMDPELQFAMCRRCPKSYHRKCLPRKIAFEDLEDEDIIQRAWEGLMPNRILIYCLKHDIDDDLGTPIRNHIKFPNVGEKKKKLASDLLSSREKVTQRGRSLASEDAPGKRTDGKALKRVEMLSSFIKERNSSKNSEKRSRGAVLSKKQKVVDTSSKPLNKSASTKVNKATADESGPSLGERLYTFMNKDSEPVKSRKGGAADGEHKKPPTVKPAMKEMTSLPPVDADTKRRIMALMKDASSSITLENIIEKHKVPTTHAYSSRNVVDKTITLGKVEGSIEAVRAALQKLEEGCSIEDAKAVCEPGLLNQMTKWKNKLKVYLAPFLHGMRYTSFGRHFTKVDKLKEIVDMLHLYVQDGDMIVDFCCGANDFSCLMKKKLDETGKKCSYKNYDVLPAKNDFNFEKRDWMSVRPKELPTGSQLIMGLNPPFGVNATLANKFINKALEFKPKLLILIVPQETERLDKKEPPYDLVWEDDELLAGKSFYLPGSVDVNDKQMDQWNVSPPPLYLWSRPDWTAKHKEIAQQHGHSSRVLEQSRLEENHYEMLVNDYPVEDNDWIAKHKEIAEQHGHSSRVQEESHLEENHNDYLVEDTDLNGETFMLADDHSVQNEEPELLQGRATSMTESHKGGFPCDKADREGHENHGHVKNQSEENSKKRRRGKGKLGRGSGEIPLEDAQNGQRHSPPKMTASKSLDSPPSKPLETSSTDVGDERYRHFDHSTAGQFQTGYGYTRADDMARRYSLISEVEPYSSVTHRWSNGASPGPDFAVMNMEQQFPGFPRESIDSREYRRTYISEMDEKYGRESNIPRLYPDSLGQRSSYLAGPGPGPGPGFSSSPYGHHLGSAAADSTYARMNTSAMQRYAPRLDELNHSRTNTLGSESFPMSRSSVYDPPRPPQSGYRADSLGFAPGPYNSFSQQNTSGWLNE
uniref:Zinc finger PHD-type domain-containing protein n=1 Tax=Davidia involucrata TaxID=16924 RepID=A0A5B7BGT9_DAVIN